MATLDFEKQSYRRLIRLTGDWVLVSPGSTKRPWKGQTETPAPEMSRPTIHSATCVPGTSERAESTTPNYIGTFVFENDYAALQLQLRRPAKKMFQGCWWRAPNRGICLVVCFSPRHDLTLAKLSNGGTSRSGGCLDRAISVAGKREPIINSVVIFENRGVMMGASNPHPHGQIWANAALPNEPAKEQASFRRLPAPTPNHVFCANTGKLKRKGRNVLSCENDQFAAIVPVLGGLAL